MVTSYKGKASLHVNVTTSITSQSREILTGRTDGYFYDNVVYPELPSYTLRRVDIFASANNVRMTITYVPVQHETHGSDYKQPSNSAPTLTIHISSIFLSYLNI